MIPFPTHALELSALQDRSEAMLAKINAMKITRGDIHQIEQLERQHHDCLKYIAKLWVVCKQQPVNNTTPLH